MSENKRQKKWERVRQFTWYDWNDNSSKIKQSKLVTVNMHIPVFFPFTGGYQD